MKKTFCDICKNEIVDVDYKALTQSTLAQGKFKLVEIIIADNEGCSNFDVCIYCVIDAIKKLDDRPSRKSNIPDYCSRGEKQPCYHNQCAICSFYKGPVATIKR